jgi:phosphatidylglycerol lysyltransferase
MRNYRFQPPATPRTRFAVPSKARNWRRLTAGMVPPILAGSGLLNLVSLMGGPSPGHRLVWLHQLFPLEVGTAIPFVKLLLGLALVLTAVPLWGRKKRALPMAVGLACASSILSARDHHWWHSAAALGVAALLVVIRKQFRVGAGRPSFGLAVQRVCIALYVAMLYGIAGFWFLDPREFGRNFHWWEATAQTLRAMFLLGDTGLTPRTPYASWFLDSLVLMSASVFAYCIVVLFRPVRYHFSHSDTDQERARRIGATHARSGQDFFKQSSDKSFFFSSSGQSFLAYRVAGYFALVLGDPVGPEEELKSTVAEFVDFCQDRGWRVGFHQVQADRLGVYEQLGFRGLKIGDDAVVDLDSFSLSGSAMKEFRNTVTRLGRLGYRVERFDPGFNSRVLDALKEVSDEWLAIPGHRERRFTLGKFDPDYVQSTTVYAVFDPRDEIVGFLNLVPSYQSEMATVDLMRRRAVTVNGLMDYLFAMTFLDLKDQGVRRFSLGMAPVAEFGEHARPTIEERVVRWAMLNLPFLFRADSLRRFKAKYADQWEPRYDVYRGRLDLPRLALALRSVTEIRGRRRALGKKLRERWENAA